MKIQGFVLSSFFYGYAATQLVGGYLGAKFGGKKVFGAGIAATAALTLLTPWAASVNVYLLLVLRTMEGIFEGMSNPAIYALWSKWAPPLERSRLLIISFAGMFVGSVVGMPLSSCLIHIFGWTSVFYSFGVVGLLWYLAWTLVVAHTPQQDRRISYEELKYITESLNGAVDKIQRNIPWKHIFTSVPVWTMIIGQFSEGWGFCTLQTLLPKFMKHVLKFDLTDSGFMSALPYVLLLFTFHVSSHLADWLLTKGILTTTQVRKTFTCLGFLIQAAFLTLAVSWLSPVVTTACLTLGVGLGAMSYSGLSINYLEVAPAYASVILGLGNMVGSFTGVLSPILSGYIVTNEDNVDEWKLVFYIAAGIYLFGAFVYGIFASGELQSWAVDSETIKEKQGQENELLQLGLK